MVNYYDMEGREKTRRVERRNLGKLGYFSKLFKAEAENKVRSERQEDGSNSIIDTPKAS